MDVDAEKEQRAVPAQDQRHLRILATRGAGGHQASAPRAGADYRESRHGAPADGIRGVSDLWLSLARVGRRVRRARARRVAGGPPDAGAASLAVADGGPGWLRAVA